jgi:hypothetical protein
MRIDLASFLQVSDMIFFLEGIYDLSVDIK